MNKGFWKISFSILVPSFFLSDVKHPPKSKNFEIFPTSNSNNSKTKKSFEILKTPLNPACGDEHIGFFSFFLGSFPDLEKTVGSVNPVHFSRELLVKNINHFHQVKPYRNGIMKLIRIYSKEISSVLRYVYI